MEKLCEKDNIMYFHAKQALNHFMQLRSYPSLRLYNKISINYI